MIALLATALIWGVTFAVTEHAVDGMAAADLVAWRFGLGAVVLVAVAAVRSRGRRATRITGRDRRRAVALGAVLGAGFLLQAWALTMTDALMSGFLTSLLVVFAPLTAWLVFRERITGTIWTGVLVTVGGLALLSFRSGGFGPGELLTLVSAALWGVHLVLLSRWCTPATSAAYARIQVVTVAVLALAVVAVGGTLTGSGPLPQLPSAPGAWAAVLFLAVLATAAAMLLLSWGQARVSASRAAVLLALEPAVAGVTAAVLGAPLTTSTVVGAVLLIGAVLVVELPARRAASDRTGPSAVGREGAGPTEVVAPIAPR
ncbi:DMT family transporter [Nakamurella alba]|uniref:DMT family transporter n=1 Tax=Nakamurella alba TaxID=2665158 RepID=UPI0018ABAF6A|nr:DMT family transporter [Nakamurella alba]